MKRALIVGSNGQDGRLLRKLLVAKGYRVTGLTRQGIETDGTRAGGPVDVASFDQVRALVESLGPREIYYLAAFHHSARERTALTPQDLVVRSMNVNALGPAAFLEAVRTAAPDTRFFYAGSCLAFGQADRSPQNEACCLRPRCIYGISKTAGTHTVAHFRQTYGLFAVTGILYNHESALRAPRFLSRAVVRGAWRIARGLDTTLTLADLDARADWGFAPDFVEGFWRSLQAASAADYVLATGVAHSVRDWVEAAFALAGLDWRKHVREEGGRARGSGAALLGDASKARAELGWNPATGFEQMVAHMYESEGQTP